LRCDVRPSETMLALMDRIGLNRFGRYAMRMEREATVARVKGA
jgi:phage host-nuclease inhibitor protein Gam